MARIKGIDLPNEKRIVIALTRIYGVGSSASTTALRAANIDLDTKVKELDEAQLNLIRAELDKLVLEGDLRRETQMNIKKEMEINSYRGTRHKKKLPVRGQRTSRNSRTRRGKKAVVANKKK